MSKIVDNANDFTFSYTYVFESCYSESYIHEFIVLSILIVTLGLQFILEGLDIFGNTFYQLGYLSVIATDLFIISWYCTRLQTQCCEIGEAAYSTLWYRMEPECRRDIQMIILRSQYPPKITGGKLMVLNLNTYMNVMNNTISWLTLFHGLLSHDSHKN